MARLFISHSSRNNDKAIELRDWLAKNGWDDVFLDLVRHFRRSALERCFTEGRATLRDGAGAHLGRVDRIALVQGVAGPILDSRRSRRRTRLSFSGAMRRSYVGSTRSAVSSVPAQIRRNLGLINPNQRDDNFLTHQSRGIDLRRPHAGHFGRVGFRQIVLFPRGTLATPQARRPNLVAAADDAARARGDF
jgi:hypothetical protein